MNILTFIDEWVKLYSIGDSFEELVNAVKHFDSPGESLEIVLGFFCIEDNVEFD